MIVKFNDPKYYLHYTKLNSVEKGAYEQLYFGLCEGKKEIPITVGPSLDEMKEVYYAVYYDHSELFWYLGSGWTYSQNGKVVKVEPKYNKYATNIAFYKGQVESAKSQFLEGLVGKNVY